MMGMGRSSTKEQHGKEKDAEKKEIIPVLDEKNNWAWELVEKRWPGKGQNLWQIGVAGSLRLRAILTKFSRDARLLFAENRYAVIWP